MAANSFPLLRHATLCSSIPISSPSLPFLFSPRPQSLVFRNSSCCLSFVSSSSSSPSSYSRIRRVSTGPVEHAPAPDFDFGEEIARLDAIRARLRKGKSLSEKLRVLDADSRVRDFFAARKGGISEVWGFLEPAEVFLLKCLVAAGQGHVLGWKLDSGGGGGHRVEKSAMKSAFFALAGLIEKGNMDGEWVDGDRIGDGGVRDIELLKKLLKTLSEVEQFYDCIGGIIGYQIMALQLLSASKVDRKTLNGSPHLCKSWKSEFVEIHVPTGLDLLENTEYASQAALWGIKGLPELGELYPLGGAGDRLDLVDPETG